MLSQNTHFNAIDPSCQPPDQRHVHFIGIGGTGMCGLAEVMFNLGWQVSGSDIRPGEVTFRLQQIGIKVHMGHAAENIENAFFVVYSAAIEATNPELAAARKTGRVVVARGDMLASFMQHKKGVAVAGSHGKTTTTTMIAALLAAGSMDPTYIIGGKLRSAAANGKLGIGPHMVAEADESDGTFLRMNPKLAVVTNIDAEHLSAFQNSISRLFDSFHQFLDQLSVFDTAVICMDDDRASQLAQRQSHRVVTYGFSAQADFRVLDAHAEGSRMRFTLGLPSGDTHSLLLSMSGRHNILNMLAAIAVASTEGVSADLICQGVESYTGVSRRLEVIAELPLPAGKSVMMSDYGHHPRELRACLDALAENWPDYQHIVVFQPHRYSRTHSLFGEFIGVLSQVEDLILLPTYAAGELPLPGCDSLTLARQIEEISGRKIFCPAGFDELRRHLKSRLGGGELVLFQGAGDIGAFACDFVAEEG
ncbi:MAG: UDP-N-acetylmuramate--L-alanine ligase [Gammaproteobacteria bacterium]